MTKTDEVTVVVRAHPASRKEKVVVLAPHSFEIWVREPATQQLANRRIAVLLAAHYGVFVQQVRLLTGATSPKKRFLIRL